MTTNKELVFESLSPEMIEKGEVKKSKITDLEGKYEIGVLQLFPKSKIRKHLHTKDWEIYIMYNKKYTPDDIISICKVGEEHEIENDTDEVLKIIYIKGNKDVAFPEI